MEYFCANIFESIACLWSWISCFFLISWSLILTLQIFFIFLVATSVYFLEFQSLLPKMLPCCIWISNNVVSHYSPSTELNAKVTTDVWKKEAFIISLDIKDRTIFTVRRIWWQKKPWMLITCPNKTGLRLVMPTISLSVDSHLYVKFLIWVCSNALEAVAKSKNMGF